jgi:hypothetical protein
MGAEGVVGLAAGTYWRLPSLRGLAYVELTVHVVVLQHEQVLRSEARTVSAAMVDDRVRAHLEEVLTLDWPR